jgi:hypothetical protein
MKLGKKLFGGAKALFSKGKAWVKSKAEAGKKWVKAKTQATKDLVKRKLGLEKKTKIDERSQTARAGDVEKALTESMGLLGSELSVKDVRKRLPGIKRQYRLSELQVVHDPAAGSGDHKYHVEAAASPKRRSRSVSKGAQSKYVLTGTNDLKAAYYDVREWFYKKGFRSARKSQVIAAAADKKQAGWYWCPGFGVPKHRIRSYQITLDHRHPVAGHWNSSGFNSNQEKRYDWYDSPHNLIVLCGPCNSRKGAAGRTYKTKVGDNFKGWLE